MKHPALNFKMSETMRTTLLILMIALAVGFILWMRHQTDSNFSQTLD